LEKVRRLCFLVELLQFYLLCVGRRGEGYKQQQRVRHSYSGCSEAGPHINIDYSLATVHLFTVMAFYWKNSLVASSVLSTIGTKSFGSQTEGGRKKNLAAEKRKIGRIG